MRAPLRESLLAAVISGAAAACAPYPPPFTQASPVASAPAAAHKATVVFLWPTTSCDPAGYYTLVTGDGRFLGNVGSGTQLRAEVPAGDTTVVGWNQAREESTGFGSRGTVPVLHAHLAEGRTYYVRMLFGEWDETGPGRSLWATRSRNLTTTPVCRVAGVNGPPCAMVTLAPGSPGWRDLPSFVAKLEAIVADRDAGQAWVDAQGETLRVHVTEGEGRYAGLRPEWRRMATLEAEDGVTETAR